GDDGGRPPRRVHHDRSRRTGGGGGTGLRRRRRRRGTAVEGHRPPRPRRGGRGRSAHRRLQNGPERRGRQGDGPARSVGRVPGGDQFGHHHDRTGRETRGPEIGRAHV